MLKSPDLKKIRLTKDVVSKIILVYQRLAADELLRLFILAKTQNANVITELHLEKMSPGKKRHDLAAA